MKRTKKRTLSCEKSGFISLKKPRSYERGFFLEVPPRFELGNRGFADRCLTTWLWYQKNGADDEARTRYLHLGKVALYQMSYIRKWCLRPESNQRHEDFQSSALPTELQRHKKDLHNKLTQVLATRNGFEPSTSSVTG